MRCCVPGELVEVKLIRDKHTGFPAGYGFVEFSTRHAAEEALETLNGQIIRKMDIR
jgi:RNA recognition motif-containing protein